MDDFGQQLKERMHAETADTWPSERFWETVAEREKAHVRQRVAWGVAGVAASIAVLALAVAVLPGIGAEEERIPTVTGGPEAPEIPSEPVVVAEGELPSGETWQLQAASHDVWPEGRGEPGELCAQLTHSSGARSVNCAATDARNVIDGHHPVFVLRGTPRAATLEHRFEDGTTNVAQLVQHDSPFGVTWATADLSDLAIADRYEELAEIAILDQAGEELVVINANGGTLADLEGEELFRSKANGEVDVDEQRAPQSDQLETYVDFELYTVAPPNDWQHLDTYVRDHSPEPWIWVETRWTPSGGPGGQELDARLDLRQTDLSTLGDQNLPVNPDADEIELPTGLTAYLATDHLPSGVESYSLEWQQGHTYLQLTGEGLTRQDVINVAATAEEMRP